MNPDTKLSWDLNSTPKYEEEPSKSQEEEEEEEVADQIVHSWDLKSSCSSQSHILDSPISAENIDSANTITSSSSQVFSFDFASSFKEESFTKIEPIQTVTNGGDENLEEDFIFEAEENDFEDDEEDEEDDTSIPISSFEEREIKNSKLFERYSFDYQAILNDIKLLKMQQTLPNRSAVPQFFDSNLFSVEHEFVEEDQKVVRKWKNANTGDRDFRITFQPNRIYFISDSQKLQLCKITKFYKKKEKIKFDGFLLKEKSEKIPTPPLSSSQSTVEELNSFTYYKILKMRLEEDKLITKVRVEEIYDYFALDDFLDSFTGRPTEPLSCWDCFCGVGGLSLGFHSVNITTTVAVDNFSPAIETFASNFPESLALHCNIDLITNLVKIVFELENSFKSTIRVKRRRISDQITSDKQIITCRMKEERVEFQCKVPSEHTTCWYTMNEFSSDEKRELVIPFIRTEFFKNMLPSVPGALDILAGGVPCQAFSLQNRKRNTLQSIWMNHKSHALLQFLELSKYLLPKFIVIENVIGLCKRQGTDPYAPIDIIRATLCKLNYDVTVEITNSVMYGAAQSRNRVFVIASRKSMFPPQFPLPIFDWKCYSDQTKVNINDLEIETALRNLENGIMNRVCVEDCIGDLPMAAPSIKNRVISEQISTAYASMPLHWIQQWLRFQNTSDTISHHAAAELDCFKKWIPLIPCVDNANWEDMESSAKEQFLKEFYANKIQPTLRRRRKPNARVLRRLSFQGIVNTLLTVPSVQQGNLHPRENRLYTVRECARLQGFPDNYLIKGDVKDCYTLIGNAVPQQLGIAIASTIVKAHIINFDRETRSYRPYIPKSKDNSKYSKDESGAHF